MKTVVITVRDGIVSGVYSDVEDVRAEVIDFDTEDSDEQREADAEWFAVKSKIDSGKLKSIF